MNQVISVSEIIAYSKVLTRCSDYIRAIKLVASNFNEKRNPELIFELIRLSILLEQYDTAYNFIENNMDLFNKERKINEEIMLRLNIATQFSFNIDPSIMIKESRFNWVKIFKEDSTDPVYVPEICTCNIECDGITKYNFALLCQCCGVNYRITINGTLLVQKSFYCPSCLSRQILKFDAIRSFLHHRHNQFFSGRSSSIDCDFNDFSQLLLQNHSENDIPEPLRILGQDTLFAITQVLLEDLTCD
jgi:hypothetical protein